MRSDESKLKLRESHPSDNADPLVKKKHKPSNRGLDVTLYDVAQQHDRKLTVSLRAYLLNMLKNGLKPLTPLLLCG